MAAKEKERVCKNCGYFTTENKCENCNSEGFVEKSKGKVVVFNVKESQIAEKINANVNGKFALKYG